MGDHCVWALLYCLRVGLPDDLVFPDGPGTELASVVVQPDHVVVILVKSFFVN